MPGSPVIVCGMTTTTEAAPEAPEVALKFTTSAAVGHRPTITFDLDGRTVTATAPKAARWTRLWVAFGSGETHATVYESLRFLDVALGDEVARWLKAREDDPEDPYDLPALIELVGFLEREFEPLLKDQFEAAGMAWAAGRQNGNRAARRSPGKAAKTGGARGSAAAKRKSATARKSAA